MTDLKDLTDKQIADELGKLDKETDALDAQKKRLADERDRRIIAQWGAMPLTAKELNQLLKQFGGGVISRE